MTDGDGVGRRPLLHATAALVTAGVLPAETLADEQGATSLQECDVCGAEFHPDDVEHTAVATTAPIALDVCRSCQFVQNHDPGPDHCYSCGEALDGTTPFYVEVEYPLGVNGVLATLSAGLCGECAGWIAFRIHREPVAPDGSDAQRKWSDLVEEQTIRANQLRDDRPRSEH